MSLKHGLLGLLNYEPMTGYDLDKLFNISLGYFWQAQYSQVYSELDKMEKKGWLTSERVIQDDKPNKRVYSITAEGKTAFMDWLSTPETDVKSSFKIKSAFLMRLFFASEINKAQTLDLLHSFHDVCLARGIEYDKVKESIVEDEPNYNHKQTTSHTLTALYGEMMNQARLAWVEKAITTVENMEDD